jgi:hypothetical protein
VIDRLVQMIGAAYAWASAQPLFIQIPIGLAIFLAGLYLAGWVLGLVFLTVLNLRDRKNRKDSAG